MAGNIIGTQNPAVGTTAYYEVSIFSTLGSFSAQYEWHLFKKQKNNTWKDITGAPKTGKRVPYTFGEIAAGVEFEMKVYEKQSILLGVKSSKKLLGTLIVLPTSRKVSKIEKVVLFNRGAKDSNKAGYRDTLIAQAHCIALFNQEIEFHLWEDDAPGKGHNAAINKNNRHTRVYKGVVNEKGIAEVKISLSTDERILRQMANQYLMRGDKNEGANHEYYVTASYAGKIQKASQVNVSVSNPDYKSSPPVSSPKKNLPKSPAGQGGKKQPDPNGNIVDAVFINDQGKELSKVTVGNRVRVRIHSKNLVGNHIQYIVWEYDAGSNDEIYRSESIKITADLYDSSGFIITKGIFDKGTDLPFGDPDADSQHYFIEIIMLDIGAESVKFGVDSEGLMEVENVKSPAVVKATPKPPDNTSCICKEQYKDLVWGEKVSCEFRKKVVQICAELWGESRKMEMASGLMAVMNVETAGSFKAHQIMGKALGNVNSITKDDFWLIKKDKKTGKEISRTSRAVGLIQFTQAALQEIEEFESGSGFNKLHEIKLRFATMGEVKQLDYVKKYFEKSKNKIKTPEDIYLQVFAPEGVGKSNNYVLYSKEKNGEKYTQNESIDKENNNDGIIQRSEILNRYKSSFSQGKNNKTSIFSCQINDKIEAIPTAKDIITYHIYNGGKIEKHIPKIIKNGFEKKYKYVYHDKNNIEHEFGIFNFKTTTQIAPGNIVGSGDIELVDIREFRGYNSNGIKIKFKTLNTETNRYYINPNCYAGLLGAMADMNIDYLGFNGFSNYLGKSTGGSKSHRNGEKGDLRYLSKNRMGEPTILQDKHFDIVNQNKFNDILYTFGWGNLEKMYSEYFTYNGNKNYLLNHTKHMRKDGKNGYRHYHHLHLTGFNHALIKIINEK